MDWVVHGYKFGVRPTFCVLKAFSNYVPQVEFNFGVVDMSSGMARVEASKEARRSLVIVGEDGFTEYSAVRMVPTNWSVALSLIFEIRLTIVQGNSCAKQDHQLGREAQRANEGRDQVGDQKTRGSSNLA